MANDTEKGRYTTPEGSKLWEYLAFISCAIMGMCIGSVAGWNSPSIVKLMSSDSPIAVTPSDVSTLVAMVAVGHMLAPPLNSFIVDRLGRKYAILFSAVPLVISWGLITIATNVWMLDAARFMAGLSLGLYLCALPMYIGEIASKSTRGIGGALNTIMFNLGILAAYVIVPYLSIAMMAVVFLLVTLGFMISFWFMPDSPYYLVIKNKMDEAEAALEKLRGKTDVSEELDLIVQSVTNNTDKKEKKTGGIKQLLMNRGNRRAFIIMNLVTFTHHFGGYLTILTYGQLIFKSTASVVPDHQTNIVLGVVQLISAIITTFLVDKLGRKPLLLFSGFGATASNLLIGVFFYMRDYLNMDVSSYSLTVSISAMLLVFAFNCGLLSMYMVLMSELFATEIKTLATCILGIVGGCLGIVAAKVYILLAITWNYGNSPPFLGFFAIVAICTGMILYLLPETKGKTFVQIQKELND